MAQYKILSLLVLLVIASARRRGAANECTALGTPSTLNACWRPLSDYDAWGFETKHTHIGAMLQSATKDILTFNEDFPPSIPYTYQCYRTEAEKLLERIQTITTQNQYDEIAYFDNKGAIGGSLFQSHFFSTGAPQEELLFIGFGISAAVYDGGIAVWREKLANSRVRPPTVLAELYGDQLIQIDGGNTVRAKDFRGTVRIMPHSEWPSGSSSVCQVLVEMIEAVYPHLPLQSFGVPVEFSKDYNIVLPQTVMPKIPGNLNNPAVNGYNTTSLNQRCGETRQEGGMHFTAAIPDGAKLVEGMGINIGNGMLDLIPGLSEDVNIRDKIAQTPNCNIEESACDGTWELPPLPDGMTLAEWTMDFFNVPEALIHLPPFNALTRGHAILMDPVNVLEEAFFGYQTIYHFRTDHIYHHNNWAAIAANSEDLKTIKFGQSKEAREPLKRSGVNTTDARLMTVIHAQAAAIPYYLTLGQEVFSRTVGSRMLNPTYGFEDSLFAACGDIESDLTWNTDLENCLIDWYDEQPSPARMGQIVAYENMFFRIRDGFNSLGTDGGCVGGPKYCPIYKDRTGYNPESGACTKEPIA